MLGTLRTVILPILILGFLLPGVARADNVDRLIKQLRTSNNDKVRISAAANLGKVGDSRAIKPLLAALRDKDKNVRAVAARSLGRLIDGGTSSSVRKSASRALERAASRDSSSLVRREAKRALADIRDSSAPEGGVYVNIGAMTDKSSGSSGMRALMRKTVEKTLSKRAASMMTSWPGGKPPSAKQLRAQNTKGFHVDGTLVSLTTQAKGSATLVSCKISMLIATYPKKSMFGFLDGGARVQSDNSSKSIQYAQEDCVAAVVEDLVARKIIPTIETRSK